MQGVLWIQHQILHLEVLFMVCVGIDVAKDKHDCCILCSEGKVLANVFTIPNSMEGGSTPSGENPQLCFISR